MHRDIQTPLQAEYMALVAEICAREPLAYRWFVQVIDAALLWDHVVDGDPIDKERAHRTFQALTMEWVCNDWFVRNRNILVPVINGCVAEWQQSGPGAKSSYLPYTQIPSALALILHGSEGQRFLPAIHANIEKERFEDVRRDHPPFFIVGLPRSRTAWLAAFLTDGEVTCYHELTRRCDDPRQLPEKLLATKTPIVGDADPTLTLFYADLQHRLPQHKVVFILRDATEAQAAHKRMVAEAGKEDGIDSWPIVRDAFCRMREACPDAMSFRFEDLDKMETMRELSEYCTALPFNEERWRIFDELKITALAEKVLANQRLIK